MRQLERSEADAQHRLWTQQNQPLGNGLAEVALPHHQHCVGDAAGDGSAGRLAGSSALTSLSRPMKSASPIRRSPPTAARGDSDEVPSHRASSTLSVTHPSGVDGWRAPSRRTAATKSLASR